MIIVGLFLVVAGYAFGAKWEIHLNKTGFHVPAQSEPITENIPLETFTSIDAQIEFGDVTIISSDENKIKIVRNDNFKVHHHIENGKLTITDENTKKGFNLEIGIGITNFQSPSITIYVPKDIKLQSINIVTEFGDTNIKGLDTDNLLISSEHGDTTIKQLQSASTQITHGFGDIELLQFTSNELFIESEHGDVDIEGLLLGSSVIQTYFGDADLQLQNSKFDLSYTLSTDFGDVSINRKEKGNDSTLFSKSNNQLEVNAEHGDIDLEFRD